MSKKEKQNETLQQEPVVEEQDGLFSRAFDALRGVSLYVAEWVE